MINNKQLAAEVRHGLLWYQADFDKLGKDYLEESIRMIREEAFNDGYNAAKQSYGYNKPKQPNPNRGSKAHARRG